MRISEWRRINEFYSGTVGKLIVTVLYPFGKCPFKILRGVICCRCSRWSLGNLQGRGGSVAVIAIFWWFHCYVLACRLTPKHMDLLS